MAFSSKLFMGIKGDFPESAHLLLGSAIKKAIENGKAQ